MISEYSCIYYLTNSNRISIYIFYPDEKNLDTTLVNNQTIDTIPVQIRDNVREQIDNLKKIGYQCEPIIKIVNNFISLNDKIIEIKQKIMNILPNGTSRNPFDLCMFGYNYHLKDLDASIYEEFDNSNSYLLLDTKYTIYQKRERDNQLLYLYDLNINGNPYLSNEDPYFAIVANELQSRMESNILNVTNMNQMLLISSYGKILPPNGQIELFIADKSIIEKNTSLENKSDILLVYWYQHSSQTYSTLTNEHYKLALKEYLDNRNVLNIELFPHDDKRSDYLTFEREFSKKVKNKNTINEGFASGLMMTINSNNKIELDLNEIFDSFETSDKIPFIKYNTGIEHSKFVIKKNKDEKTYDDKDEKEEKIEHVMYNRIYKNFIHNSSNLTKTSDWINTNRRVHSKEMLVQLKEYYTINEKSIIFQLLIDKKLVYKKLVDKKYDEIYASVSIRYDGNVTVILNWNYFYGIEFILKIVKEVHKLLTNIKKIIPSFEVFNYNHLIAEGIIKNEVKTGPMKYNLNTLIQLSEYLESIGVNLNNFDYVIDIKWQNSIKFEPKKLDNLKNYKNIIRELSIKEDSNLISANDTETTMQVSGGHDKNKNYVSSGDKKILFYKKVDNYVDFFVKKKRGRTKETLKQDQESEKFSTLIIMFLNETSNNSIRIHIANLHKLHEFFFVLNFVQQTINSSLEQLEAKPSPIIKSEMIHKLSALAINEEDRLKKKAEYTNAINKNYPKGIILNILDPLIFDTNAQISRTSEPSKHAYGITFYRFLHRIYTLLSCLVDTIITFEEKFGNFDTQNKKLADSIVLYANEIKNGINDFISGKNENKHIVSILIEKKLADEKGNGILNNLFKLYPSIRTKLITSTEKQGQEDIAIIDEDGLKSDIESMKDGSTSSRRGSSSSSFSSASSKSKSSSESGDDTSLSSGSDSDTESDVDISTKEEVKILINKMTYLLTIYYLGLEYNGIFYLLACSQNKGS